MPEHCWLLGFLGGFFLNPAPLVTWLLVHFPHLLPCNPANLPSYLFSLCALSCANLLSYSCCMLPSLLEICSKVLVCQAPSLVMFSALLFQSIWTFSSYGVVLVCILFGISKKVQVHLCIWVLTSQHHLDTIIKAF